MLRGMLAPLFAFALAVSPTSWAASLDRTERKVVREVHRATPAAEALLEELVRINSGTGNHAGVRAVGDRLASELDALGFQTEWVDSPQRAGHLIARRQGTAGPHVLLIGHLDTVFEPGTWEGWQRDGDVVRGPGVFDMKGGDVVMVLALQALHRAGVLDALTVTVVFTGDEEKTGRPLVEARAALVEAGKQADYALGFEPGIPGQVVVARRGSSGFVLEATGKQGHSMHMFSDQGGYGAIYELARILDAFRREVPEPLLTFNPGLVVGGTQVEVEGDGATVSGKRNVVAQRAVAQGDLRFISTEQLESARAAMRAIVESEHLPGTSATITFSDGYPAMPPTGGNQALLRAVSEVSEDLGAGPLTGQDPATRGAADVSWVAPHVACLDGLGLAGSGAHGPDEQADLSDLDDAAKRAAVLLLRLGE